MLVHLAEPVAKVGVFHTTDAVFGSVALLMAAARRRNARSMYTENLLRCEICHVKRAIGLSIFSGDSPGSQLPALARQLAKACGAGTLVGSTKVFGMNLS